jgi:serine/threonine protein kinase
MGETITQIGRYEISRQLVETALASVYDAFDPVERKPVAIRVPRTTQTHGIGALSVGMKHPGLMKVLTYEENKGETFLVLEPFDGVPLDNHHPPGQKLEPAAALDLLRQLASTLDYAHSHGCIHGSLHPASILLNDRRQVKVLDFGPTDLPARDASPLQLLRAVYYLSPETIRDRAIDGRSDQFSLAVLAHRLLTGELPFGGTPIGVMFRIAWQGLERDAMGDLPPAAQTVLQRALAKSPSERFSTCTQMVSALDAALIHRPVAATRLADASEFVPSHPAAPPIVAPSRPSRSREMLKYFGLTFVGVALLLAAIFYFLLPRPVHTPAPPAPAVAQPQPTPAAQSPVQAIPEPPPAHEPAATIPAAKAAPKAHAKKKSEPEVELKPVEPKIIRQ